MWIHEPTAEEIAHPKACKSCGAAIVFAKTKLGKIAPINAGFKILGSMNLTSVEIVAGERTMSKSELVRIEDGASHFATCPQKQQFRKQPRRKR